MAFDLAAGGEAVHVHRRTPDGTLRETVPFRPFLLLTDPDLLTGLKGDYETQPLSGRGALRWCVRCGTWSDALRARDHVRETAGASEAAFRFLADPIQQYLLLSGRTSFLGLRLADVRRMALDIEVFTSAGFEFPNAARAADRIIAISLADSQGFRHVIRGDRMDEAAMLAECSRLIRERDPDVIEGHNIFRFDLEYLEARAGALGVSLPWGRAGEPLRGSPSRLQIAERSIGYRRYQIAGRHVADTWILAQLYDVSARDLPSLGLKEIARHLGVAAPGRTYVDGGDIARLFADDPERLFAYALDDAVETLGISAVLSPPYFAQAQALPFDFQACVLRGNATKIDALLMREYLRRAHAIPLPSPGAAVAGGHTAVLQQGVARPVLHVDVTSLYPSLMLTEAIAPATDDLGVFPALLASLRTLRLEAKQRARLAESEADRVHLNALQQSFKILINSFYGYLGFSLGHWNDFDAANRVTLAGRRVVTAMMDRLGELGATVVEVDTDGVYFVPPDGARDAAGESALLAALADSLPDGISVELAGRYAAMLSYKMKNYVLLDAAGKLTIKGSSLRSRGLEAFQRVVMEELFRLLLAGRGGDVPALVSRWMADFSAHRVPVRLFAKTETLQESLETYRAQRDAGTRAAAASYELALSTERPYQPGDQISYYVTGRSRSVPVNECARPALSWDPAAPDENTEYYQTKLQELWTRFRRFVEHEGLRPYVDEPDVDPDAPVQLMLF